MTQGAQLRGHETLTAAETNNSDVHFVTKDRAVGSWFTNADAIVPDRKVELNETQAQVGNSDNIYPSLCDSAAK